MTDDRRRPVRFGVLAYGPDLRRHLEATVAVLTLREFAPPDASVVVLTDQPGRYRWLAGDVTIEPVGVDTIAAWRGPTDDRFRPKIEALRCLGGDAAHAVLVDTDTMARADLTPLVDHLDTGGFLLYEREYQIAAPPRRGDRCLRDDIVGRHWNGILADERSWMWNGGVIGISGRHQGVADRALAVFDEMRAASRHFALEQLAYSIVFPAYGPVREAVDRFVHYWANRAWFDRRIARYLSATLIEGLSPRQAGARLRARPIEGPLDGRRPKWQKPVMRFLRIDIDDDVERDD
jgi:hypothetical protein